MAICETIYERWFIVMIVNRFSRVVAKRRLRIGIIRLTLTRNVFALMLIGQLTCDGFAQPQTLGQFSGQTDIGPIKHAGSVDFDKAIGKYVVTGSGANMWSGHDEFHFVWKRLRGDFIVSTRAQFLGDSGKGDPPFKVSVE